jgi:radical SAM-linked protein
MSTADYVQRLRLTFRKEGAARYISHLDVARTWERTLNRARIPMAYTHGFNRRPRMQFAAALPLGVTSECEIMDILLVEQMQPEALLAQLAPKMAPGLSVVQAEDVVINQPSLPALAVSATYRATLKHVPLTYDVLQERVVAFVAADTVVAEKRTRKRGRVKMKQYDLRALVYDVAVGDSAENPLTLTMCLKQLPSLTGRPDELLRAFEIDPHDTWIHRIALTLRQPEKTI